MTWSLNSIIKNVCQLAYFELSRISFIRYLLSVASIKKQQLLFAIVLSRLGSCNSLLSGCPTHLLQKRQEVQNSVARLVQTIYNIFTTRKQYHVSPLIRTVQWLPIYIQAGIDCKLSALCHSFIYDKAPAYMSGLLHVYTPSRQLRSSSDSRTLPIPYVKTKTFGHRSCSYAAPSVWNSLPRQIRHIQSTTAFKTVLMTHLFKTDYC